MADRLRLDFSAPPYAPRWAGRALLAMALLLVVALHERHRELRDAQARLGAAQAQALRAVPAARGPGVEERKHARAAGSQLALPWARWIEQLERASLPNVALLSLHPDTAAGLLRLKAETTSDAELFDYLRRLTAAGWRDVHLLGQERGEDDASQRFYVQAAFE